MKGYGQGWRAGFRQSKALTERQTRERSTNFTSPNMSCEVTASLGYLPFAPRRARRLDWVGSSSSPDGEAAVRPRLTLERQVTSRLLPDFTYQATGSSGRQPAACALEHHSTNDAAADSAPTAGDSTTRTPSARVRRHSPPRSWARLRKMLEPLYWGHAGKAPASRLEY